jgi:hypothetical protein
MHKRILRGALLRWAFGDVIAPGAAAIAVALLGWMAAHYAAGQFALFFTIAVSYVACVVAATFAASRVSDARLRALAAFLALSVDSGSLPLSNAQNHRAPASDFYIQAIRNRPSGRSSRGQLLPKMGDRCYLRRR